MHGESFLKSHIRSSWTHFVPGLCFAMKMIIWILKVSSRRDILKMACLISQVRLLYSARQVVGQLTRALSRVRWYPIRVCQSIATLQPAHTYSGNRYDTGTVGGVIAMEQLTAKVLWLVIVIPIPAFPLTRALPSSLSVFSLSLRYLCWNFLWRPFGIPNGRFG